VDESEIVFARIAGLCFDISCHGFFFSGSFLYGFLPGLRGQRDFGDVSQTNGLDYVTQTIDRGEILRSRN